MSIEALAAHGIRDLIAGLPAAAGWRVQYGDLAEGAKGDQAIGVKPYEIEDPDLRLAARAATTGVQVFIRGSAFTGIDPGLDVRAAILAAAETRHERVLPNGHRIAYCIRRLATPPLSDSMTRPQWFDSYYVRSGIGPA